MGDGQLYRGCKSCLARKALLYCHGSGWFICSYDYLVEKCPLNESKLDSKASYLCFNKENTLSRFSYMYSMLLACHWS